MSYRGPERRVYRVIVTQNREYHMRDRHCLRVRDRRSGRWIDHHQAINCWLIGSSDLAFGEPSLNRSAVPLPGECVYLGDQETVRVLTSPVLRVRRASLHLVNTAYPKADDEDELEPTLPTALPASPSEPPPATQGEVLSPTQSVGLWGPSSAASLGERSARSPFKF